MLFYHFDHHRAWNGIALTSLVVVPASTGFLTEAAHLAQKICRFAVLHARALYIAALANSPANVIACQITHAERTHGKTKFFNGFVDLRRCATFFNEEACLTAVLLNHAVANKAIADARNNGCFLDLLAQCHDSGQNIFAGFGATNHFQQFHDVGRTEKVHAHHIFRTLGEGCNFVHIECGCVGSQNSTWLHDFVEFLEDGFLDAHLFEHSLNDQVCAANVVIA